MPIRYLFVVLAILSVATCIGTAVALFRTTGMPGRWLWAIVAVMAAPVFTINWTTGVWDFRPIYIQFFGAGVVSDGAGAPWLLSFGLPLGAAVALWSRSRWRRSGTGSTVGGAD